MQAKGDDMGELEKSSQKAMHGQSRTCEYRCCEVIIGSPVKNQKFCSSFCRESEWEQVRQDGKVHTSWELMIGARVLDYRSAICDLRKRFDIITNLKEVRPDKSRVFEYQLVLEV